MRSIIFMLLSLILSGCQINPYTFQPDWTSPDWFTGLAGKSFPASCDATENAVKLHESWQQRLDESMRSSRLN